MTGYGTDPAGECEVSAWEMRGGIGAFGGYVRLIIATGVLTGLFICPRRTQKAWALAGQARQLPHPSLDLYEELLALSVGTLRQRYGVPKTGSAGRRVRRKNAP